MPVILAPEIDLIVRKLRGEAMMWRSRSQTAKIETVRQTCAVIAAKKFSEADALVREHGISKEG